LIHQKVFDSAAGNANTSIAVGDWHIIIHVEEVDSCGGWGSLLHRPPSRATLLGGCIEEAEQMQHLARLLATLWHILSLEDQIRAVLRDVADDTVEIRVIERLYAM
jgi:hypothetical protein